jgi:fermentation-respiration switch protein FrsA (DUF1100 family)
MIILIPVLVLAAALVLAALCLPEYFYRLAIGRKKGWTSEPGWLQRADCEAVSIRSPDGLVLRGRWVPVPGGADTVILVHGHRGDGLSMAPFARFFYEDLGCNVLIPDARGHGLSEGSYAGFGWHERLDMLRWLDWVRERVAVPAHSRVILFGVSMGAATVMMAAGEPLPPEVKAVIEDCGYTSAEDEFRAQLVQGYHLGGPLGEWLLRAADRLTQKRAGYGFREASALEQVKKAKVPILFIHGDADSYVPFNMVFTLYEACPAEKELYIAKGAGHGQARDADPAEYQGRIARFLEKHAGISGNQAP